MKKTILTAMCAINLCFSLSAAASRDGYEPIPDAVNEIVHRLRIAYNQSRLMGFPIDDLSPLEQRIVARWFNDPRSLLTMAAEARANGLPQPYIDALDRLLEIYAYERQ